MVYWAEYQNIANWVWLIWSPISLTLGTLGNILAFIVMRRKNIRGSSSSVYFASISIADTLVLFAGIIPTWVGELTTVFVFLLNQWTCKVFFFSLFSFADIAIWLLVGVTLDRFVAVCFPHSAKRWCTRQTASRVCLVIPIVAILKNTHLFWTKGNQWEAVGNVTSLVSVCGHPSPAYAYFETYVRPWIAMALYAYIPVIVVVICNLSIVLRLRKLRKKIKPDTIVSDRNQPKIKSSMTIMFISVSLVFLILVVPSITVIVSQPIWVKTDEDKAVSKLLSAITENMVYVHHGINFYLYCLTGKRFRAEVMTLFRSKKQYNMSAEEPTNAVQES
ncbi:unnamed protein product [Owenia fusiformis]|uniref:G-protein coupled receptors family 1 profile domain-containing protein n=1 Tax=Owenia fusiformis TaxID=6347 RepID=A0A8S4N2V1_OWEFU|nr:unnamed protein product [Owenia fusiformis]